RRHGDGGDVVVLARLECAVAPAEVDAHPAVVVVAHHQVLPAVRVHVGGDNVVETVACAAEGRVRHPGRDGAAAVEEHTDGAVAGAPKPPLPSFSSTLTLLLLVLATARSGLPSPLRSATAKPRGLLPTP